MYRQSEKNLLSSNISSTCSHNMVNFGPLAAEIVSLVWGTPANFNGFRVLAALLYDTVVVGVSQTAALNRGRHLYSAGRPSRWAFAHICSFIEVLSSHLASLVLPPLLHTLLPSKVIIREAMTGHSTSVVVHCSCFGFRPSPISLKKGHSNPYFLTHVYCGQTVAHLSYC